MAQVAFQYRTPAQKRLELSQKFIETVRDEPIWFAENVLNHRALPGEPSISENPDKSWELDQFQRDLLEACADVWRKKIGKPTRINHDGKSYITVRSGHGSGKTHTAAMICDWFNTAFPGRAVCTAPKLAQLRTRVWGALRKIDARAEPYWRSTHVIHDTVVNWLSCAQCLIPNAPKHVCRMEENKNWTILAETATQPENIQGHHERCQLILVEEATGVSEALWPAIFGATGQEITILLMIANPTKVTGTFANSHLQKREEENYFRYHISLKNSRRIKRDYVEKMVRKYGKDSPVVAVRCYGEFPTSDPNQLVALEWLNNAFSRDFTTDGSIPRFRLTADVADGGEDESVITIGQHFQSHRRMREQRTYNFPHAESPIRVADAMEEAWRRYGCRVENGDDMVVDSLGVGAGTCGELMRRGYPVVRYIGGESSSNPARWRNRRVQSYIGMRDDLRDGLISFDEEFCSATEYDDFMAQMCSVKTKPEQTRVDDLTTKEEMRRDGVTSPDRADSLAMQYATQSPRTYSGPGVGGADLADIIPAAGIGGMFRG